MQNNISFKVFSKKNLQNSIKLLINQQRTAYLLTLVHRIYSDIISLEGLRVNRNFNKYKLKKVWWVKARFIPKKKKKKILPLEINIRTKLKIFYYKKNFKIWKLFYIVLRFPLKDYKILRKKIYKELLEIKLWYKLAKREIEYRYKKWYFIWKAIVLYNKLKRKYIWKSMMRVISWGINYKNTQTYLNFAFGKSYFYHYNIIKNKPDLIYYTKFGKKYTKRTARVKKNSIFILKIFLEIRFFEKLKFSKSIQKRLQNIVVTWIRRNHSISKFSKRNFLKLAQSWGNYGKLELFKFKKKSFFFNKELVIISGKEYFRIRKNKIVKNKLKFLNSLVVQKTISKKKKYLSWQQTLYNTYVNLFGLSSKRYVNKKKGGSDITKWFKKISRKGVFRFNMTKNFGHPFHLVSPSIKPTDFAMGITAFILSLLMFIRYPQIFEDDLAHYILHTLPITLVIGSIINWIFDIYTEEQSGFHTLEVQKGFQYAILLFILSELMLFFSFFWAYFHFSLNPHSFTGGSITPRGVVAFFWFRIPLLNTALLLASGISLSIAHIFITESDKIIKLFIWISLFAQLRVAISKKLNIFLKRKRIIRRKFIFQKATIRRFYKRSYHFKSRFVNYKKKAWHIKTRYNRPYKHVFKVGRSSGDKQTLSNRNYIISLVGCPLNTTWQSNFWLFDTIIKGFVFLIYQAFEYTSCMFSINDSVYGSLFFSITGLHGMHVCIGVFFLLISLVINISKDYTTNIGRMVTFKKERIYFIDRAAQQDHSISIRLWTHRIAFDGSAWYWHFVDIVWLFVFLFIYWWGFSVHIDLNVKC